MNQLTNDDLNQAIESDVVSVRVEEDVGQEAPHLPSAVWVIGEERAETFHDS